MIEPFILYSLVQAFTEFLPVSSSLHLDFVAHFFKLTLSLEQKVALHFGTFLGLLLYFWKDIIGYLKAWFFFLLKGEGKSSPPFKESLYLLGGTLPAIIVGFLFKKEIETLSSPFFRENLITIVAIAGGGIMLFLSDHFSKVKKKLSFSRALGIGILQILAFIPGFSRSGACLIGGRLLGLSRGEAIRFTFLLSLPVVGGASVLMGYEVIKKTSLIDYKFLISQMGLTAFFSLFFIYFSFWYMNRFGFFIFMIYRILLSLILGSSYFLKYYSWVISSLW